MKNMDPRYFAPPQYIEKKCVDAAARDILVMLKVELPDQVLGQGSAEISDPVIFL